ncbi:MAG: metallophosphoesterase family protein, partial [Geminicoccales bacterium]
VDPRDSLDHWAAYMASDGGLEGLSPGFPFLRLRGPLALIGLSTAVATPPTRATGKLGKAQLGALDALLARLAASGRCRVVLLHHSPLARISRPRKRLVDAAAFCAVIARHGADLVLHGHEHVSLTGRIAGRQGDVPEFGAACASMLDHRPGRRAQYRIHGIERASGGFRLHVETRRFDAASGRFRRVECERVEASRVAQPFLTSARQSGPEPMP